MESAVKTNNVSERMVTISEDEYNAFIAERNAFIAITADYNNLKQQLESLKELLRLSQRKRFAPSSEQTPPEQLNLFNEAEQEAKPAAGEPTLTQVKAHYRKRTRLTTDKLPEDLPVETITHELPAQERVCPDCKGSMHKMGEDCREELKLIPARAVIVRHVRHIYACRSCERHSDHVPIVKAVVPQPVIKGGIASPESVAHIAAQKFVMGSPLYRQEQEWSAQGILLSRQTMSNWLIKACEDWLVPLYDELKRRLLSHDVLHADETTLQVLHEQGRAPQSKSYMWLYRTSGEAKEQIILYEYQKTRSREHPTAFLRDFRGYLHTDGYDGYHKLPEKITVVGCWAHCRRKFDEALKALPKERQEGSQACECLAYCNKLFYYEKQFAPLPPEERRRERERLSMPLMEEFFARADNLTELPQSLLGKALAYTKNQRKYLRTFLQDGRLELSNNRAERSIRPFVIGRKNWLFSNTPKGARASAVYYSLIETAKENGLSPYDYLVEVFTAAPAGTKVSELLPIGEHT
jgi:transposase